MQGRSGQKAGVLARPNYGQSVCVSTQHARRIVL